MKHIVDGKIAVTNNSVIKFLQSHITKCSSLLDLGCGPKLYSNAFREVCDRILTVDAWKKLKPDVVADLEKENIIDVVKNEKFDYIIMLDFIEHLDKAAGKKLIEECKSICNKKIFLFTPLEEIWTDNHHNVEDESLWCYGNEYDHHKSVWAESDFVGWNHVAIPKLKKYYFGYYEK
jgi:predicted TPR repeat methyltransferase